MTGLSYLVAAMLIQLGMHLTVAVLHRRQWLAVIQATESERQREREAWAVERQQLLDRIQAPSFGEYKQAEIKVIKAQNGDREASRLEPL